MVEPRSELNLKKKRIYWSRNLMKGFSHVTRRSNPYVSIGVAARINSLNLILWIMRASIAVDGREAIYLTMVNQCRGFLLESNHDDWSKFFIFVYCIFKFVQMSRRFILSVRLILKFIQVIVLQISPNLMTFHIKFY